MEKLEITCNAIGAVAITIAVMLLTFMTFGFVIAFFDLISSYAK